MYSEWEIFICTVTLHILYACQGSIHHSEAESQWTPTLISLSPACERLIGWWGAASLHWNGPQESVAAKLVTMVMKEDQPIVWLPVWVTVHRCLHFLNYSLTPGQILECRTGTYISVCRQRFLNSLSHEDKFSAAEWIWDEWAGTTITTSTAFKTACSKFSTIFQNRIWNTD